jgi:CBS domain-containing protein
MLKIKEVMIPDLTSVSDDTPIKEAVKIMSRQRSEVLPIYLLWILS